MVRAFVCQQCTCTCEGVPRLNGPPTSNRDASCPTTRPRDRVSVTENAMENAYTVYSAVRDSRETELPRKAEA